ncbi:F3L24.34 PROTEIN [Salix viminalis]|uniref:F3L24.34 PROTEIN n=1 Tax=Salix viminalis TaxID=40686 RepID=A0A9Q0ZPK5_SALVM|nr:F3L24.34 PROTEIN [Salix viminalis]
MEHLLLFVAFEIETLSSQVSDRLQELINNIYLHPLAAEVGFSLNSIGELISISSLRKISISDRDEIELGKSSPSADVVFWTFILDGEIENSNEEADEIEKRKGAKELKSRLILCIYSLEFCITSLIKETREIEKHVKELVAWENP